MGNKRKFSYDDVYENEYIFNCLVNYPEWAKVKLTPSELQIFKTQNSIRTFVTNATGDQKRLLLAKANIRFISMYIDLNQDEPLTLTNFNKLYKMVHVAQKRVKVIEALQAGNTFATSSREVLNASYLIAQNCHTPYYYVNQNFHRVYTAVEEMHMRNLKKYDTNSQPAQLKDLEMFRDVCVNFYLTALLSEHHVKVSRKLDMMDVQIMMHLFLHRDMYIEKRVLQKFLFAYKPATVSNKLFRLVRDGYIDVNRSNKILTSYTIAELGIITVNEIMEKVTEKALIL